ncbi:hypothetical protein DV737_g1512, partial [Chaetothyriales sp. CBS 132003]
MGIGNSISRLLLRTSPALFFTSGLFAIIDLAMVFSQPFILGLLLERRDALSVISLFCVTLIGAVTEAHMKYELRIIGVKVRAALTAAIYDKGLSNVQSAEAPDPSVLVEVDLPHIFEFIENYHIAWMLPLQVILSLAALTYILDAIFFLSLSRASIGKIQALMYEIMQAKDARVDLVTEVLQRARQLKLAALQNLYANKVAEARAYELSLTAKMAKLNAFVVTLMSLLSATLMLSCLAVFMFRGGSLTSNVLFPALAFLFNIVRAISTVTQIVMRYQGCVTGLTRIRNTLLGRSEPSGTYSDDNGDEVNKTISVDPVYPPSQHRVCMKDCVLFPPGMSFGSRLKPLLTNCSLKALEGELVVLTGSVGSGKTTVIKALVEGVAPSSGSISLQGTVAYAPQDAFLMRGTVKENILFGSPYDSSFYNRVIQATCLQDDFIRMPHGDETMLGSLGMSVSGGQKSRIGLARAIYARRDIVILDDPLAAVDPRVSAALITNVLGPDGLLKDSTRIPVGSILNCFTNDMQKLDSSVNGGMMILAGIIVACSSSIIVILATSILSAIYLLPIGAMYSYVQNYYLSACRQLRYLENVARGPILDSIAEVYSARAVITAFDQVETFSLVMNFVVQITSQFNILVQTRATLEADFTSVLRIWNLSALEPECTHDEAKDFAVSNKWSESLSIRFESFSMGYEPNGPLCLRDISIAIEAGEHVAIVGRTGAGKSSIATSLLRGVGSESIRDGRILVGGVDIARLSLSRLRKNITLMTQDPLVFTGTVRDNLDPEGVKGDAELEHAIQECQLAQILDLKYDSDILSYEITNSGNNMSSGQIQTLALARAMLSHNSLIILDEGEATGPR